MHGTSSLTTSSGGQASISDSIKKRRWNVQFRIEPPHLKNSSNCHELVGYTTDTNGAKPLERVAIYDEALVNTRPSHQALSRIRWQGQIESVQCRAWVWRYKRDNRAHHHLGFNLFVIGEVDGREGRFIVAVIDTRHTKLQFRIGDVFKGTAWPCIKAKHDIADYSR